MILEILKYILGGLTIGTALMVIFSKHPIRSVLFLVATFFLISGHYILLNAQFLAIVNIIVYAGAIMVLFLFVLMLLDLSSESSSRSSLKISLSSILAGGILFVVLLAALKDSLVFEVLPQRNNDIGLVENLGKVLFTKYIVAFEVSSVLIIASMVGAVVLAKKEHSETSSEIKNI